MRQLRSRPDPKRLGSSIPDPEPGLGDELKFIVKTIGATLALLWGLELADQLVFAGGLDAFGIHPREVWGLLGILASPLLHGGFGHLSSNTVGLLVFGTLTLMWGRREFLWVTLASTLIGGLGTWLIGATGSVHIGASGVVFGYFGYVLARGFYERKFMSIVVSLVVGVMFGSMVFGAVPGMAGPGISWECHLFGLIGGVLVARRLQRKRELES